MLPALDEHFKKQVESVQNLIMSEVNVKDMEYITDTAGILVKKIKPNFKVLGPKYGKYMKQISAAVAKMNQSDIYNFEKQGAYAITVDGEQLALTLDDVEILSEDIPGWLVANEGRLTVALDINITKELREEGIARELINRIQNLRKDSNFNVTDKITLHIGRHEAINEAVEHFETYIASQVLANAVVLVDTPEEGAQNVEIDDIRTFIKIEKI